MMLNGSYALSIVVIGRNQANLLKDCLRSIQKCVVGSDAEVIYIDTNSSDHSMDVAAAAGVISMSIDPLHPSAAIARNVGWKIAKHPFVFFLDGDTLLAPGFIQKALPYFSSPQVAAVCGQRRERYPDQSPYQQVLDLEWAAPASLDADYCGGDVIFRKNFLEQAKGYNDHLIAGEEPELCQRVKAMGGTIVRLDTPMTYHDLKVHHFSQYWKRCFRTGFAYADVANKKIGKEGRFWRYESLHNLIKGGAIFGLTIITLLVIPWSLWPSTLLLTALAGMLLRTALKTHKQINSWRVAFLYAIHSHFQHIPMFCGQVAYFLEKRSKLIEYH